MKNLMLDFLMCVTMLILAMSASAYTIEFQNWGFNPNVAGFNSLLSPIDEITLLAMTLNNSTPVTEGHGTFKALTTFDSTSFQNNNVNIPVGTSGIGLKYQITGIMEVVGRYDLNDLTGKNDLVFESGTMKMYLDTNLNYGSNTDIPANLVFGANDGLNIASFNLLSGTGTMDYGLINPDGRTDLHWEAISLANGYWFDPSGNDMSQSGNVPLILAMTDSNNTVIRDPSNEAKNEFTEGTGFTWTAQGDEDNFTTFLSSNGSFAPAPSPVPEPATMLLLGLGLIGIAGLSKNKIKMN